MTMKREASIDKLRGLVPPAPVPRPSGALDIAVLGNLLVERHVEHHADGEALQLKLFGRLDADSVRLLQAELPDSAGLLDLTRLDSVEPAALKNLTDRQREEHEAGRSLLLRIAPHQVANLNHPGAQRSGF